VLAHDPWLLLECLQVASTRRGRAEEMTILPGMDELSSLLWIAEHHDKGEYDVIVVDAAPTGETLRLLSLPEAGEWWLEHIFPIQRRAMQIAGPVLRGVMGVPVRD